MLAAISAQDWTAVGHDVARAWHEVLALAGPAVFAVALLALVVRALAQHRRYRAVGVLSEADLESLHAEVRAAEQQTVGEIVPVLLERCDEHPAAHARAALATTLCGSLLMIEHLPWDAPELLLLVQIAFGAAGFALARALPGFARAFVFERRATHVVEEQALVEFTRLGLHRTQGESGVLILVSLFERRVVVLGDRGIDGVCGAEHWQAVDRAVLEGVRAGRLSEGLRNGVRACGKVLAQHFPRRADDVNELPDRIVVRRE